jgi:DNA-binding beta-propeller fold protein YncE
VSRILLACLVLGLGSGVSFLLVARPAHSASGQGVTGNRHQLLTSQRHESTTIKKSPHQPASPEDVPAAGGPTVSGVQEDCGPVGGGSTVVISGSGLTGATAVHFGSAAATSYTVSSDTSVTAHSPAASNGTVDVTVTTASGTSSTGSADEFTYGGCAYVANFNSGTISVLNAVLALPTSTISLPAGSKPDAVALTPDGSYLYVADPAHSAIYCYATATNSVVSAAKLTSGIADPTALRVVAASAASYLLVANSITNSIEAFTLASDLPASTSPTKTLGSSYISGVGTISVVPNTSGLYVLFTATAGNTVGEINTSTWAVTRVSDPTGDLVGPDNLGYSTDGTVAYVTTETGPIYAVSTSLLTINGEIAGSFGATPLTKLPSALACTTSTVCFESDAGSNKLGVISTASPPGSVASASSYSGINGPVALALVPATATLLLVDDGGGNVGFFNTTSLTMTKTVPVGTSPCAISVMGS